MYTVPGLFLITLTLYEEEDTTATSISHAAPGAAPACSNRNSRRHALGVGESPPPAARAAAKAARTSPQEAGGTAEGEMTERGVGGQEEESPPASSSSDVRKDADGGMG